LPAFRPFGRIHNASDGTSPGQPSSQYTMSIDVQLLQRLRAVACAVAVAALSVLAAPALAAEEQFLEPDKAFQFSARAGDDKTVEVLFRITPGYYMYREQLRFDAGDAALGVVQVPPGKIKYDETFQKNLETHRGDLRIRVPVTQAGSTFKLDVVSQGCADAGLCYPPMTSSAQVSLTGFGGDGSVRVLASSDSAAQVRGASPQTGAPRSPAVNTASWTDSATVEGVLRSGRFWLILGAFFVMGLLLSFTPCVLPMMPILSSIIAGSDAAAHSRVRALSLAGSYSLGMALVYAGLGVAAGLAGEGLAAHLQSPWVLTVFAALLAVFALSMFDVYELRLPVALTHRMTTHSQRLPAGQLAGVFVMGAVSALIVSPCVSAPLAGALVFISQTRDVTLGGSALFSLAAGMSMPLLLIGVSADAWLPESGPWMTAIKRLFGVLLLGVAIWIVQPALDPAAALVAWGMLLLVAGFMLRPFESHVHSHATAPRTWLKRATGVAALVFGVMQIVGAASGGKDPLQPLVHLGRGAAAEALRFLPVRNTDELDTLLRSPGRPVMLDFYADWCVSCKEMERFTFTDPAVAAMMSRALLLKADVTANSAADRELLRRFRLFGPPGTIFFDGQGRELDDIRVIGFQNASQFSATLRAAGL
jgi:thioredoxin:protein disulfide reductase